MIGNFGNPISWSLGASDQLDNLFAGLDGALRLLIIVTKFPAMSETFILDHITAMLDRGCDVEILAQWREAFPKEHSVVNSYRLMERTTYLSDLQKRIPENKLKRVAAASELIRQNGVRNFSAIAQSLNVFSLGRSALTLRPMLLSGFFHEKPPFDVIHCHYGPNGILAENLMKIGAVDGKLVISFHGYDLSRFVRQKGDHVYRDLFARGDMFLPVNQKFRDELVRLGCDEQKIRIHRMGIDLDEFSYPDRKPKTDGGVRMLSVGRLVEKKGFRFAIEAFARVAGVHPAATYDIVGDGPEREHLQDIISGYNLDKRIRLLGWKTRNEVIEFMDRAELFLSPSVVAADGDSEGIPVVLMEAMAKGLPVVSTNHGGIPELVQHHRTGYLVPERDVAALATAMTEIICNPDTVAGIAREARRHVEKEFDCRKQNDHLIDKYRELTSFSPTLQKSEGFRAKASRVKL